MHEKLSSKLVNRYFINLSLGLQEIGYQPKVMTSTYEDSKFNIFTLLDFFDFTVYSKWIPSSICGLFSNTLFSIKSIWMALSLALNPLPENPQVVFTDMNLIAVFVLKSLTNYKLFYIKDFLAEPMFSLNRSTVLKPTKMEIIGLKYPDQVIVATFEIGSALMRSSYCLLRDNQPRALYPTIDIDISINHGIRTLIPDIDPDMKMFVTIGNFHKSANLELAVVAFEELLENIGEERVIEKFVLVVAGYCKGKEEERYYNRMSMLGTSNARSADHIRFVRLGSGLDEKLLIEASFIAIHPAENDVFSDFLVKSMSFSKPIVATDNGIASKLLLHGTSAVIVPPLAQSFAWILLELLHNQDALELLGNGARRVFEKHYSFRKFTQDLEVFMRKYA